MCCGCCSRTTVAVVVSFIFSVITVPFLILALLTDHTSANVIDRNANPNHDLGGAFYRVFYTKAEFCEHGDETCFETTREKLFENILDSRGCQSYYSAQDASLAFAGMGIIGCAILWFLFVFILCFERHRSLMLRRVVKLVYAVAWVFLLISFFVTIGLSYSIKCSSWDGPLSDRFQFRAENLVPFGVSLAWLLISTVAWAVNERHIVTESEEAVKYHTVSLGDPDGVFVHVKPVALAPPPQNGGGVESNDNRPAREQTKRTTPPRECENDPVPA